MNESIINEEELVYLSQNKNKIICIILFVLFFQLLIITSTPLPSNIRNHSVSLELNDQIDKSNIIINEKIQESMINISLISPESGSIIRSNSDIKIGFAPIPSNIRYRWDDTEIWDTIEGKSELIVNSPISEKIHFIEVHANDSNNEWSERVWAFRIDDKSIFITLNNPEEYSTLHSGENINISFDPEPLGKLYAWDNEPYSSLLRPLPEGDGQHILKIQVEDNEGNWYTINYYYFTDDTPPDGVLSIENNSLVRSKSTIYWTEITEDVESILYNWDGSSNKTILNETYKDTFEVEFIVPNLSMWHELNIYTNDSIGNEGFYRYRILSSMRILLEEHPMIAISEGDNHTEGIIFVNSNITIPLNYSDLTSGKFFNWWENDTQIGFNETELNNTHLSGIKKLSVYAQDSLGFWDTLTLVINIDDTKPVVEEEWYENESKLLSGTQIEFEYSEELGNLPKYSWDTKNNITEYFIQEDVGKHSLKVYIMDRALNWNNYSYIYFVKFNVTLVGVENNSYQNPATQLGVEITPLAEEVSYQWDDESTTVTVEPLSSISGWHILNVSTKDNENNWYFDIFRVQTKLLVELTVPEGNKPWKSIPVELSFSETPLTTLYAWDESPNSTGIQSTPSQDGNHSLHVYVENSDLPDTEWFTYIFFIIIDNTKPEIGEISIENNTRINRYSTWYSMISESCNVTYYWDEEQYEHDDYYNASFMDTNEDKVELSLAQVILEEGYHFLYFNLTDLANNTNTIKYRYLIDNTPITTFLNSPANNTIIYPNATFNITFSEEPSITYYSIDNHSFQNSTTIPSVPYQNESIRLIVFVYDGLNWNRTIYHFNVTHYLAKFIGITPNNNTIISENVHNLECTIEGVVKSLVFQWNGLNNETELFIPHKSGEYNLTIFLQDISGVWMTYNYFYSIDNDAPTIVNTSPKSLEVYVSDDILINCSENLSQVTYKWDTDINFTRIDLDENLSLFTLKAPNNIGNHTLTLIIKDSIGNEEDYSFNFMVIKTEGEKLQEFLVNISGPIIGVIGVISAGILTWKRDFFKKG